MAAFSVTGYRHLDSPFYNVLGQSLEQGEQPAMATTTIPAPVPAATQAKATTTTNPVLAQMQDPEKTDAAIELANTGTGHANRRYNFLRAASEQLPAYKKLSESMVVQGCGCPTVDTRCALMRAVNGKEYLMYTYPYRSW